MWEVNACWYKHENKSEEMVTESSERISCSKCDETFVDNQDLRKQIKVKHPVLVAKCRNFRTGSCDLTNESCWFVHEEKTKKDEDDEDIIPGEANTANSESVFHEAAHKAPPDLMKHIVEMITKLSMQVNNLEKMAQKSN